MRHKFDKDEHINREDAGRQPNAEYKRLENRIDAMHTYKWYNRTNVEGFDKKRQKPQFIVGFKGILD